VTLRIWPKKLNSMHQFSFWRSWETQLVQPRTEDSLSVLQDAATRPCHEPNECTTFLCHDKCDWTDYVLLRSVGWKAVDFFVTDLYYWRKLFIKTIHYYFIIIIIIIIINSSSSSSSSSNSSSSSSSSNKRRRRSNICCQFCEYLDTRVSISTVTALATHSAT
jgi:hypothetical protein